MRSTSRVVALLPPELDMPSPFSDNGASATDPSSAGATASASAGSAMSDGCHDACEEHDADDLHAGAWDENAGADDPFAECAHLEFPQPPPDAAMPLGVDADDVSVDALVELAAADADAVDEAVLTVPELVTAGHITAYGEIKCAAEPFSSVTRIGRRTT